MLTRLRSDSFAAETDRFQNKHLWLTFFVLGHPHADNMQQGLDAVPSQLLLDRLVNVFQELGAIAELRAASLVHQQCLSPGQQLIFHFSHLLLPVRTGMTIVQRA